jgi:CRP-like cAMP-binding protein
MTDVHNPDSNLNTLPGEDNQTRQGTEPLQREASSVVDGMAIEIMSKDKSERTEDDLDYCIKSLINVQFIKATYKRYGEEIVRSIFKCLMWMEVPEKTVLLKLGDIGYNCFILFEGSCEVLIPGMAKSARGSMFDYIRVGTVNQGVLFGEKTLLDKKQRTATVKTLTHCFLGELKKKDFITIFDNIKKIELNEEINFFKSMKLFAHCNRSFVEKFTYCMEPKEYSGEEIIVGQNDLIDNVYIVRRGLFQVYFKTERNLDAVFDLNYFSEINSNNNQRFTDNRLFEIKGFKKTSDLHKLFVLGPGEIYGDIELVRNSDISLFTLKCIQKSSEILVCKREKFLFNIGPIIKENLEIQVKEKVENYKDRFKKLKTQQRASEYTDEFKLNSQIVQRVLVDNKFKSSRNTNGILKERVKEEKAMKHSSMTNLSNLSDRNKLDTRLGPARTEKAQTLNLKDSFSRGGEEYMKEKLELNKIDVLRTKSRGGVEVKRGSSAILLDSPSKIGPSSVLSKQSMKPMKKLGKRNTIKIQDPSLGTTMSSGRPKSNTLLKIKVSNNNYSNYKSAKDSDLMLPVTNFDSPAYKNSNNINILKNEYISKFESTSGVNKHFSHKNSTVNSFYPKSGLNLPLNIQHESFRNTSQSAFKRNKEDLFILSKDKHLIPSHNSQNSGIKILNMNVNLPFYEKNSKSIFKEQSKFKFSECAEINKNFFLDQENISSVLKNKYEFIKKNSTNFVNIHK